MSRASAFVLAILAASTVWSCKESEDSQGSVSPRRPNSSPAIVVSKRSGKTSESGAAFSFAVGLAAQPDGSVTIGVASSDESEGKVSPDSLTFAPSDWNAVRTVAVTGVDDRMADGDRSYDIRLTVDAAGTSDATGYASLDPPSIALVNIDNDSAGFAVSPRSGKTSESGAAFSFTVGLTAQPDGGVAVDIASTDPGEGKVSPARLTFAPSDWNVARTVAVTGVDDHIVDGDQSYDIRLTVDRGGTSDSTGYAALDPPDVALVNIDDDAAGFLVSSRSGRTSESGTTFSFTVRLATRPDGSVAVDIASTDPGEGKVSTARLTFAPSDWNVARTVTVTGVADFAIDGDQSYDIRLTVDRGGTSDATGYASLDPPDIALVNANIDVRRLADSGQDRCYRKDGTVVSPCPKPGEPLAQDGSYRGPPLSFTPLDDHTARDNNTYLIWQRGYRLPRIKKWSDAVRYCDDLELAGWKDWRLPSFGEWAGMINFGRWPALDPNVFSVGLDASAFWSSSPYRDQTPPIRAWVANVYSGQIVWRDKIDTLEGASTRCVRGDSPKTGDFAFADDKKETVLDRTTKLVWQRQDDGTKRKWEDALRYCETLTLGSHSDWRLPNVREFYSMVDIARFNPALDRHYFTVKDHSADDYVPYFSSTQVAGGYNKRKAWAVDLITGEAVWGDKAYGELARCVRGGN